MIDLMKIKTECGVCSTPIWQYDGAKLKKTPEYHEVCVDLNNDTRMRIGVCSAHTKPKQLDLEIMSEKVIQGWLEEVAFGIGNKSWVDKAGSKIKITGIA